jgi:hypothetical protein
MKTKSLRETDKVETDIRKVKKKLETSDMKERDERCRNGRKYTTEGKKLRAIYVEKWDKKR